MRKLLSPLSAAVLAAIIGAGGAAKADDHEVIIGFAIGMSGWMNAYDGPPLVGSLMAIEEFNAQGGILGKPIRAVIAKEMQAHEAPQELYGRFGLENFC